MCHFSEAFTTIVFKAEHKMVIQILPNGPIWSGEVAYNCKIYVVYFYLFLWTVFWVIELQKFEKFIFHEPLFLYPLEKL